MLWLPSVSLGALLEVSGVNFNLLLRFASERPGLDRKFFNTFWDWFVGSDHDNLTEHKYRWMGPSLATTLAPVVCLLGRNLYSGSISFIPAVCAFFTLLQNPKLTPSHFHFTRAR